MAILALLAVIYTFATWAREMNGVLKENWKELPESVQRTLVQSERNTVLAGYSLILFGTFEAVAIWMSSGAS